MKNYKFRIRERRFEDGKSEFFPEYLDEQEIWTNLERPCSFYSSETYDESYKRILMFKRHNGIYIDEKIHDINS